MMVGACVGGAMFGDNLSMISDTTIAATRSQGCEMRDKFRVNFFIALPAAIITVIILLIVGRPEVAPTMDALEYSIIKVVPYLLVLILALVGINVFLVLTIGIFAAGIIGIATGALDIFGFAQNIWSGFTGMNEVFFLTLFCGGMSEMVTHNGGITWLIYKLRGMMRGEKSAQVGIAALVSLSDCATANNTVAIVLSGSMAKGYQPGIRRGSPPHRLLAGCVLLRAAGHDSLWCAAAVCGNTVYQQRRAHEPHGCDSQSVVLLGAGHCGHPVHLHPLRRRRVPPGPLELGVRCG